MTRRVGVPGAAGLVLLLGGLDGRGLCYLDDDWSLDDTPRGETRR